MVKLQNPDIMYADGAKNKRKVGRTKGSKPKPKYKATPQDIERKVSFRKQV